MSTQKNGTPITGFFQPSQPAANPFAKVVYSGVTNAFGNNIYGIRRASFVAQAGTTDQAIIAPNGTCSSGVATPTTFILGFGTQQATDSYDLTILGGPNEPESGNIFTQNVGPKATTTILGFKTTKGKGGRKLPWTTRFYRGPGISEVDYGKGPIPDPTTPGHALAAPGATDTIVTAPTLGAFADAYKRGRWVVDGTTTTASPCMPPLDPPTIVQTVNNGSTLGDNLQRQYAIVYVAGSTSEIGPGSVWCQGYLQSSVTIPAVPGGAAWTGITGQKVYRTKGDDPSTFYLHSTYADLLTHTFTDTTLDTSLGAAYTPVQTQIVSAGGGGGGGGGGSTGPGAATYGISVEVDNPSGDPIAWDHIIEGDDVYLDVGHTDGLTIPAGGDGDYEIDTHFWIGTSLVSSVDSHDWSVETTLNIEHWRSGSMLTSYTDQDWFGMSAADYANVGFINDIPIQLSTSIPACQAGDVIKTSVTARGSGAATDSTLVDRTNGFTWISIARVGRDSSTAVFFSRSLAGAAGATSTSNWLQDANSSGSSMPLSVTVNIPFKEIAIVNQGGFTLTGTAYTLFGQTYKDTIVIPKDGVYRVEVELQFEARGANDHGTPPNPLTNTDIEIDVYVNGSSPFSSDLNIDNLNGYLIYDQGDSSTDIPVYAGLKKAPYRTVRLAECVAGDQIQAGLSVTSDLYPFVVSSTTNLIITRIG